MAALIAMREQIHDVLSTIDRYNPANLETFLHYIKATLQHSNTYDLDAYLAVLKLFQFHPALFDMDTTVTLLTKMLMALPDNDFQLGLCLVAPEHHEKDEITRLVHISRQLETCHFAEFWGYFNANNISAGKLVVPADPEDENAVVQHEPVEIVGFMDKIRDYVAHVVSISYQTINANTLSEILGGLSRADLQSFAQAREWEVRQDQIFVGSKATTITSKDIVESVKFNSLVKLMAVTQTR